MRTVYPLKKDYITKKSISQRILLFLLSFPFDSQDWVLEIQHNHPQLSDNLSRSLQIAFDCFNLFLDFSAKLCILIFEKCLHPKK